MTYQTNVTPFAQIVPDFAQPCVAAVSITSECRNCHQPIQASYNSQNNGLYPWFHSTTGDENCR